MSIFAKESKMTTDSQRFLEFHLGSESYAVELLKVKEVITPPEMTPIPKAPVYVCGLMNLRGLVLTVIDLRKKLGITPGENKTQNAVIIFDLDDRLVGVVVDSIQKVLNVKKELIKPVPEAEGQSVQCFNGIIQQEGRLTMWIEPQSLLDKNITTLKAA
jgi:purine-binding chemotaxis protein CheW